MIRLLYTASFLLAIGSFTTDAPITHHYAPVKVKTIDSAAIAEKYYRKLWTAKNDGEMEIYVGLWLKYKTKEDE